MYEWERIKDRKRKHGHACLWCKFSLFLKLELFEADTKSRAAFIKMKFSIKDFTSKCDQIRFKLQILSHLLKKSLMENFIFCAVFEVATNALCVFANCFYMD